MKKGINKYGIKLEDHIDYASYLKSLRRAIGNSRYKTPKGKITIRRAIDKYRQTEKGKLKALKLSQKLRKTKIGRTLHIANSVKSSAAKMNRVPKWANFKAIEQFYYNCPKGYEVDHIVPFNGENVSGLHVLNNLQYLTVSENRQKGNTWICSS